MGVSKGRHELAHRLPHFSVELSSVENVENAMNVWDVLGLLKMSLRLSWIWLTSPWILCYVRLQAGSVMSWSVRSNLLDATLRTSWSGERGLHLIILFNAPRLAQEWLSVPVGRFPTDCGEGKCRGECFRERKDHEGCATPQPGKHCSSLCGTFWGYGQEKLPIRPS